MRLATIILATLAIGTANAEPLALMHPPGAKVQELKVRTSPHADLKVVPRARPVLYWMHPGIKALGPEFGSPNDVAWVEVTINGETKRFPQWMAAEMLRRQLESLEPIRPSENIEDRR